MKFKERFRPPAQEKSPDRAHYENAKKSYFTVINNPQADSHKLLETFSPLVKACYGIDFLSLESKTRSLTIFARTGMVEARRRGHHEVADSLGKHVQWLEDNLAIGQEKYKSLPKEVGTPQEPTGERPVTYLYEAPDGRIVRRSRAELDDILVLSTGKGHSPRDYSFTKTGLVLPTPIALFLSR